MSCVRRVRELLLGGLLVGAPTASLFFAASAHAETPPTRWDRAKDPLSQDRYATHVHAMIAVEAAALRRDESEIGDDWGIQRAKQMLEAAHAAESPDPLLRIDLGAIYERLEQNAAAVSVLTSALALAPHHVAAERAWNALSYAFARMDRPVSELAAYEQYLALEVDEESRASAVLNMAEAEMRLGNLKGAIAGYEEAIRVSQDVRTGGGVSTYVLAIWGLTVAKDRNGDASGAVQEARRAVSHDGQLAIISDRKHVFFVPAYEREYYLGMGELALAADATATRSRQVHLERAERRFGAYVRAAHGDDRWLARAKDHAAFAKKRAAEVSAGKPAPADDEEP
jgi:tetratricopeptide (TPR) repeat protein